MKTLVVAPWVPWPATSGGRIRLATMITALADLGDVEFFGLLRPDAEKEIADPPVPLSRVKLVTRPTARYRGPWAAGWLVRGLPRQLSGLDHSATRAAFAAWAADDYDLVWHHRVETYAAIGDLLRAPSVVDLDDLEDQLLRGRAEQAAARPGGGIRSRVAARVMALEAQRWQRLQEKVASKVSAVVVCGERDRARLQVGEAWVVPNAYEQPARPVGRTDVMSPPTLGFQGDLRRPPNAEAARQVAVELLPLVRRSLPNAVLRLIGPANDNVTALGDLPGVVVTGPVDDITDELSKVDVVVAPLRFGGGSPLKLAEALAHQIPIVATPFAVENLAVVDGVHALVRNTTPELAAACVDALTDTSLRALLVKSASELYETEYTAEVVRERVKGLVRDVLRRSRQS